MKVKPNLEQPPKLSQAHWTAAGLTSGQPGLNPPNELAMLKEGLKVMKADADHDEMFAQFVTHSRLNKHFQAMDQVQHKHTKDYIHGLGMTSLLNKWDKLHPAETGVWPEFDPDTTLANIV